MDVVARLNKNFLSCSICTDIFKDPATLGCTHTFCKTCLIKYMKTQQDAIRAKSIRCPVCKQMSRATNPSKPVEEWLKQMKPHFLIQSLMDELAESSHVASAETGGRLCFPCQKIAKTVQATCLCQDCDVTLCEDCVKMHTSIPGTSHHSISDLHGEVKVKGRRNVFCRDHKLPVEYCCKDCNKTICPKCCIIFHRRCNSVVTLKSMVTKMKATVTENMLTIMRNMEDRQINLALQQSMIDTVEQNKDSVQSEIRRVTQQAIGDMKQKQKQLMDEVDDLMTRQTAQMRCQIKTGHIDLHMFQQYSEFMELALRSENEMDLYEVYQMCQSGTLNTTEMSERLSQCTKEIFVGRIVFHAIKGNYELGRLKLIHDNADLTRKPTLHDTINNKLGDEATLYPVDVTAMDIDGVDTVVVTDWENKCLKSFYTRGKEKLSHTLKLMHTPHSVNKLTPERVVVSFPSHNEFIIVLVTPHLILLRTIETERAYECLTALTSSTLAAGCSDPPSIDIIDVKGKVIRSLSPHNTDLKLEYPHFLCTTNKGHILVSDCDSKSVYCLTERGGVIFTYQPEKNRELNDPCAVTTDLKTGATVVVDYENKKVIQLTEKGHFMWNLLTAENGLQNPHGICLFRDKLYITEYGKGTVQCFTFS